MKSLLINILIFLVIPLYFSLILIFISNPILVNATANGRFGIALGTWDFAKMICYDLNGNRYPSCANSPVKHYVDNFNDMEFIAYDGSNQQLARSAFNVGDFDRLDPSANTQFIWFHYEDDMGNTLVPGNSYITQDDMRYKARIYATSGAPGAVKVRMIKKPSEKGIRINDQLVNYDMDLPKIIDKNGYPYCEGCIFKQEEFFKFLEDNKTFNDGNGNWYGLYMLAETEYGIVSHYLTPREYAAVFNEYVEKLQIRFPTQTYRPIRFILQSPVSNYKDFFTNNIAPYFCQLYGKVDGSCQGYNTNPVALLSPQSIQAVTYNAIDAFFGPPNAPDNNINNISNSNIDLNKDNAINAKDVIELLNGWKTKTGYDIQALISILSNWNLSNYSAVTDFDLQNIAIAFTDNNAPVSKFLYSLNSKNVLFTQTGALLHRPPAQFQAPNSVSFGGGNCAWCSTLDSASYQQDVWKTTQFGQARLTQLVYRELLRRTNDTKIIAWAYWGNVRSPYWTEPLIQATWGNINHGINWLTWPLDCAGPNCPNTTNKPWPSYAGMIYLKLANGNMTWRPENAPTWWPVNEVYP